MQSNNGPDPVFTTEWQTLEHPPTNPDRPIMVYWERDNRCYLETEFTFLDGKFYDEDYGPVKWEPDITRLVWAYWPTPIRGKGRLANLLSTP